MKSFKSTMNQSTLTDYFKKEAQLTTQSKVDNYLKEEIDINWDEADNCYGEAYVNVTTKKCTARVVLQKLPESVLQKYADLKNAVLAERQPELSKNRCPRCKAYLKTKNSLTTHKTHCGKERDLQCPHCSYKTKYKQGLMVHLSRAHHNGKNINQNKHDDDGRTARFCQKCNKTSEAVCPTKCEKCFSELLYQCKKCFKLFKRYSLASYHWYTRCGVKGYFSCVKCDFKSVWRSKVVKHMAQMHGNSDSCKQLGNIKWISINHDNASEESNTHKCPDCSKTMKNFELLNHHIRACRGINHKKNCGLKSENDDHQNIESEPMKCSSCGEKFDHIYSLNVHIRCCKKDYVTRVANKSDVKVVEIEEEGTSKSIISADERYKRYVEMIVRYCRRCHKDSAIEEKNWGIGSKVPCQKCKTTLLFKCKRCLKWYTQYKALKVHLDTVCNPKEEFKCTKCSYKAYSSGLIKIHYESVHATENAECKKCGRKFKSKEYLRKHLLRCGIAAKFQCEHCPFKSKLKIYLRNHIFRSHMEPVVIDRGDMIKMSRQRFTRAASHLTAHCFKCKNEQRLGHRLKTCRECKTKLFYKCKACQKKYGVDNENACQHVKAYLETIKFECKRCGRGAISEKSLWMHEHRCGSETTFKCRFCKYAAKIKGNVTKHEKVKHPHKSEI